jgi:peptidoglycan L-alanyl-D-glutamate endopeptidase CwlK
MTFTLSAKSVERLEGVHPSLVKVVETAISLSSQDFMVVEGVRSRDAMCVNWGKGRTTAQCTTVGVPAVYAKPDLAKVTWLADPFRSNHRIMPDGFGHAVDLGALVDGVYDGEHQAPYDAIAVAMFKAASQLGLHVRWGADWDEDGIAHEHGEGDMAHFELINPASA